MTTNKFLTLVSGAVRYVQAIAASAGAGDANKIISTNSAGKLDSTFLPAGIEVQSQIYTFTEAVAAGDFVNVYNNAGTAAARKADASNNRPARGYVLTSVSNGQTGTVYRTGVNTGVTGRTPGAQQFLSAVTPGGAVEAAPSTVGQMRQSLGYATDTGAILFEFDEPIYLDV